MKKTIKRHLYLFHRWFGIGMCLLIALWFATGIIMMYVEYPELTEVERLDTLPQLALDEVRLDVSAAAEKLADSAPEFASIRLSTVLGRPAYQFVTANEVKTVFADDGSVLRSLSPAQAETAAHESGFAAAASAHSRLPVYAAAKVDIDQWTVSSVLDAHRPLHKVEVDDGAGTVVYVSSTTGQVVRDTNRNERFWNWLGSTIHWIYPWQLRRHANLWADIIIYISLAGIVSVITGGIIGWLRLRVKKPYHGDRITPYRGMHKWHHLLGLGSLLFLATFMFSGLMSMGPWGVFDNATDPAAALARYSGGPLRGDADYPAVELLAGQTGAKEVEWTRIDGKGYLILSRSAIDKTVFGKHGAIASAQLKTLIEQTVPFLLPDANIAQVELVTAYDNYYYSHHNRYRPLPVLRVKFGDTEQSWFHFDLNTGQAVGRLTTTDRVARWLYNGMHSLDFTMLFQHRPIWDFVVILLCIVGAGFSVTSVWIGWRRLQGHH